MASDDAMGDSRPSQPSEDGSGVATSLEVAFARVLASVNGAELATRASARGQRVCPYCRCLVLQQMWGDEFETVSLADVVVAARRAAARMAGSLSLQVELVLLLPKLMPGYGALEEGAADAARAAMYAQFLEIDNAISEAESSGDAFCDACWIVDGVDSRGRALGDIGAVAPRVSAALAGLLATAQDDVSPLGRALEQRLHGRRCSYSTLGWSELIFPRQRILEVLEARLTAAMIDKLLLRKSPAATSDCLDLATAEWWSDWQLGTLLQQHTQAPGNSTRGAFFPPSVPPFDAGVATVSQYLAEMEATLSRSRCVELIAAKQGMSSRSRVVADETLSCVRDRVVGLMDDVGTNPAHAAYFLECLLDRPHMDDAESCSRPDLGLRLRLLTDADREWAALFGLEQAHRELAEQKQKLAELLRRDVDCVAPDGSQHPASDDGSSSAEQPSSDDDAPATPDDITTASREDADSVEALQSAVSELEERLRAAVPDPHDKAARASGAAERIAVLERKAREAQSGVVPASEALSKADAELALRKEEARSYLSRSLAVVGLPLLLTAAIAAVAAFAMPDVRAWLLGYLWRVVLPLCAAVLVCVVLVVLRHMLVYRSAVRRAILRRSQSEEQLRCSLAAAESALRLVLTEDFRLFTLECAYSSYERVLPSTQEFLDAWRATQASACTRRDELLGHWRKGVGTVAPPGLLVARDSYAEELYEASAPDLELAVAEFARDVMLPSRMMLDGFAQAESALAEFAETQLSVAVPSDIVAFLYDERISDAYRRELFATLREDSSVLVDVVQSAAGWNAYEQATVFGQGEGACEDLVNDFERLLGGSVQWRFGSGDRLAMLRLSHGIPAFLLSPVAAARSAYYEHDDRSALHHGRRPPSYDLLPAEASRDEKRRVAHRGFTVGVALGIVRETARGIVLMDASEESLLAQDSAAAVDLLASDEGAAALALLLSEIESAEEGLETSILRLDLAAGEAGRGPEKVILEQELQVLQQRIEARGKRR